MKNRTSSLVQSIHETLNRHTSENDQLVVGVSGGPDSVFLLDVLLQLGRKNLVIAHLNHQLRANESLLDEKFVRKLAAAHHLPFHAKKVNINQLAKKNKQTIEEAGRNARYKFFEALKKKVGAKYIVTAHTRDDQVETLVMNFTRGAGLTGLQGMSVLEGALFRPLLSTPKADILHFLSEQQIAYRLDQSNLDSTFTRNKIRVQVIPLMKSINSGLDEVLIRTASVSTSIQEYLESLAREWLNQHAQSHAFSRTQFLALPLALQRETIRCLLKQELGHLQGIRFDHIEEARHTIQSQSSQAKKRIGKTLTLTKNYDIITLLRG